jgi:hypothetical protein
MEFILKNNCTELIVSNRSAVGHDVTADSRFTRAVNCASISCDYWISARDPTESL